MSDNPQDSRDAFFALGFGVLALSGPDAVKFAHAQFMSDVAALAPGRWQWSGWLTPKGRLVALFAVLKPDAETLWLLLPEGDAADLGDQLRRYVFRSRLEITARSDLFVAGKAAAPALARGAALAGDASHGVELDFGGEGGPRAVRVASDPAPDDRPALARWRRFDVEHGLPRLDPSQRGQWTPQMLSLDRLQAFSVKKGCYPGQEIVARTHFLGQAKRGLVLLEADASLAPGTEVGDGGKPLGTIVSVARDADTALALAVLPLEHDATALLAGATTLRERPLLGGLAR
ncbi:MAG TPA: folate-binding protein [Xanthomonadaceae bacterium]|nr:folate-binding protein [Xanthomonadaceae bacterium]